jgi:hypothetical protein
LKTEEKQKKAKWNGDAKDYTLAIFDELAADETKDRVVQLNERRRQVEENAKKRF